MCQLCSSNQDEVRSARSDAEFMSNLLSSLSDCYSAVARCRIKPHTDEFKKIGPTARSVIRRLVEDWV